jgi:hypothetical protein
MAYSQLPTRTNTDANASADINQLQDNFDAILDGTKAYDQITFSNTSATSGLHTESGVLKYGVATISTGAHSAGGGGGAAGMAFRLSGIAITGTNFVGAMAPTAATIDIVKIYSDVSPAGSALTVDVNKNDTTIFTTQGNRPSISAGGNSDDSGTPDVIAIAAGDRITIDIDAIGSSTAGGDNLYVSVVYS